MSDNIRENLLKVYERIHRAEQEAGVSQGTVKLVGVTKNRQLEEIEAVIRAGLEDIGENRLQDAKSKLPSLCLPVTKHFIGHLQRNKVNDVLTMFDLIHSVDREKLVRAIDERAGRQGEVARVLMQVNTSFEESKFGVDPERAEELLEVIAQSKNIELLGLMTIGPLTADTRAVAESFRLLRGLFEKFSSLQTGNCRMEIISMGMSSDFEIAIAEGANMVRVGTAIFGPRKY